MRFKIESVFFLSVSFLLAPVFYLLAYLRKLIFFNKDAPRILIVQSARIGDMVCITPVFREIKKKYPKAYIATLVAEPATGVTLHNPYIDKFYFYKTSNYITASLRAYFEIGPFQYDYSFNFFPGLLGNALPLWFGIPHRITTTIDVASRTLKILFPLSNCRILYKKEESAPRHHLKLLDCLGISDSKEKRELYAYPQADEKVANIFCEIGIDRLKKNIAISVGCGKDFRKWPLERFTALADWILDNIDANIIFTGGDEDRADVRQVISAMRHRANIFDVAGRFSIAELPSFFKTVSLFISVSTGPLYIADAMGCGTIDIIGTDAAANQAPQGNTVIVERGDVASCSYVMYPSTCSPKQTRDRMDISVVMVQDAVQKILR